MPQRAEPPKIWERNELKFLGIDLIVMLHLRSPDILIEEVQGAFFKLNISSIFSLSYQKLQINRDEIEIVKTRAAKKTIFSMSEVRVMWGQVKFFGRGRL